MADPKFFQKSKEFTLEQISKIAKIRLPKNIDSKKIIDDIAPLDTADNNKISFLDNKNYINQFKASKAGACFFKKDFLDIAPKKMIPLISDNPYHSFALIANAFYPLKNEVLGKNSNNYIDSTVKYDNSVKISFGAVISKNVTIGSNSFIGANTVIMQGVTIGKNTIIGSNCTIAYSIIGSNVKIHNGVKIGQDGFGFAQNNNLHLKVPQLGRVLIEDDVEIGSNSTIDRGASNDTKIGHGSKLDNLVQIAHNVILGKNCILVAQCGIAGSTILGNNVIVGGQVGIAGHLNIGNNVKIAGKSGVMKDIKDNSIVAGIPSVHVTDWHRQTIILKKLIKKKNG